MLSFWYVSQMSNMAHWPLVFITMHIIITSMYHSINVFFYQLNTWQQIQIFSIPDLNTCMFLLSHTHDHTPCITRNTFFGTPPFFACGLPRVFPLVYRQHWSKKQMPRKLEMGWKDSNDDEENRIIINILRWFLEDIL